VNVEDFGDTACVLVDVSSLLSFGDPTIWEALTRNPAPSFLDATISSSRFLDALQLLARTTVYEFLLADTSRSPSGQLLAWDHLDFAGLLKSIQFPQKVYDGALGRAHSFLKALSADAKNAGGLRGGWVMRSPPVDPDDRRRDREEVGRMNADEETRDEERRREMARVLVYHEYARLARAPLILSRSREEIAKAVSNVMISEAFSVVEERVDGIARSRFTDLIGVGSTWTARIPPVAELVWRTALELNISILEATLRVRQSPEAQAFRTWLHTLSQLLMVGTRPAEQRFVAALRDLLSAAKAWCERSDATIGMKRTEIDVGAIPTVGWISKLAGMPKIEINDRWIHAPPEHVVFVSKWYSEIDKSAA
jgi:hypothetical protein